MTKPNYTHLSMLVDRSGSMSSIREDSQGGLNTLIKEQAQAQDAGDITVTLYEFDDNYNHVFGPVAAQDAPQYTLVPRGSTALLDSMGKAITDTGKYLRDMPEDERPDKVIFVVVTDGGENASREYSNEAIKKMVTEQQDRYSWEFIFLGANIDAFGTGSSLGIYNNARYHSTGASAKNMYAGVSNTIYRSRSMNESISSNLAQEYDEDGNEHRTTTT